MFWRRKGSEEVDKEQPDPSAGRQVWLRTHRPTEAVFGTFPQTVDLGDSPGKVYADEIDPSWADPATADEATQSTEQDGSAPQRD